MCGIVGIASWQDGKPPTEGELRAMCDSILHRGPDDDGMEIVDSVALGMRRLSIIDIAGGKQPMRNEDESIRVVFNGEIYNFRELKKDLVAAGHRFRTNSDTEVIVHAYEEYGVDFLSRLNGMFAIALHDIGRKRLLLARDQLGIKPLFYSTTRDAIVWGSEIKALLTTGRVERDLDPDGLGEFFAWEYVPGAHTLFKTIRKLEPGHYIDIQLDRPKPQARQFWDIPTERPGQNLSYDEWTELVDEKLHSCVKRQLISDVPLGAFLSGGVDSSLIVAAMGKANTYSIGFDDPSYNELAYSKEVAEHLNVSHTTEVIKPHVADLFEHLMHFMDDPIGDFSIFPTYLVSRLARKHVTVSLSGDGGDELFAGYETYVAQQKAALYEKAPQWFRRYAVEAILSKIPPRPQKKGLINKAKRFVEGCAEPASLRHARWRIFMGDAMRQSFFTPGFTAEMSRPAGDHIETLFDRAKNLEPISQGLYVDTRSYLVDNCLVKTDRMSMAVSLEARVPFLDTEMVETAFAAPDSVKIRGGETKAILKRVAARNIPRRCVYRPKEGFSIPIKHWLATQFRDYLESATSRDKIAADGIFDPATVARLKSEHLAGAANHSHILWSLVVFDRWKQDWLEVH